MHAVLLGCPRVGREIKMLLHIVRSDGGVCLEQADECQISGDWLHLIEHVKHDGDGLVRPDTVRRFMSFCRPISVEYEEE